MATDRIKANMEDFSKSEGLQVGSYIEKKGERLLIISDKDQRILIEDYLNKLYDEDNDTNYYNLINAEDSLLFLELNLLTNIALIEKIDGVDVALFTFDDIYKNRIIINDMLLKIPNYRDFMYRLKSTVAMVEENNRQKHSMSSMVDNVYAKLLNLLDAFQDLNPDSIKALVEETNKSEILRDAISIFKTQTSEKKPE